MQQVPPSIEQSFHWLTNLVYGSLPQPVPEKERLQACKIVSHRGEQDNKSIIENTIPAFDVLRDTGVWGLEFDVRWTKDLQPVVFHDKNLQRIFGSPLRISQMTLQQLKRDFPLIPTLEDILRRYGGEFHIMVELKQEPYPDPVRQSQRLQELLQPLRASTDYHLLSLYPDMFQWFEFAPVSALLPVSILNAREISELTLQRQYGGIAGHFAFLNNPLLVRHKRQGQQVGTGFVFSRNCLFRELNRGVDWIFTNHARKIQSIRDSYL